MGGLRRRLPVVGAALLLLGWWAAATWPGAASRAAPETPPPEAPPAIRDLIQRSFLDDYQANVVLGWRIVTRTEHYGARYAGNRLRCTNCHLEGGTRADAIPLYVDGLYPKWRAKNGRRNDVGLRIRECFVYSLNGILPPPDAPEVQAVAAYIHHLSQGRVIGESPPGRGVPELPDTGYDPNAADGAVTYGEQCAACHGEGGEGSEAAPPLWGPNGYNKGAGMNQVAKAAGFIWANMPLGAERTLTPQQAKDVAAFLHQQHRPLDPRVSKIARFVDKIPQLLGSPSPYPP